MVTIKRVIRPVRRHHNLQKIVMVQYQITLVLKMLFVYDNLSRIAYPHRKITSINIKNNPVTCLYLSSIWKCFLLGPFPQNFIHNKL